MSDLREFLKTASFQTWREYFTNGYTMLSLLTALEENGVFAAMKGAGPKTARELAAQCNVVPELLDASLSYVALADELVVKAGDTFALTEKGADWLFKDPFRNAIYKFEAYECLHANMTAALRGDKRYAKDFTRRGDMVAKFSELGTRMLNPHLVAHFQKLGATTVGDLGCGAAHMLIDFCRRAPELRGIGIDIDEGSLGEARRRVGEANLGDRIRVAWGDITKPETYAPHAAEIDAFNCVQALHEFMAHGQDGMLDLLKRTKQLVPNKYFVITEFRWLDDDEYRAAPLEWAIPPLYYQYIMHPHSWQGLPIRVAEWKSLFERAGFEIVEVAENVKPFVTYVVRS